MLTGGVGVGLLSALSFGAGDFAGGVASRRAGALAVVAGAHSVGLVALLLAAAWYAPPLPDMGAMAIGLLAGVAGAAGLAALYRGMALGTMGLVTALSGVGSLSIPLAVGALVGASISELQLIGVACAAGAGVAASGASRSELGRQALLLAGLAALSFGAWYVLIDVGASMADPLWVLVLSRAASASVTAVAAVGRVRMASYPLRLVVAAGLLDVCGNAFYVLSLELLPIGLAAALTGLYPVVTMVLARVLIGERLPRLGQVGVGLALLGILLISLG